MTFHKMFFFQLCAHHTFFLFTDAVDEDKSRQLDQEEQKNTDFTLAHEEPEQSIYLNSISFISMNKNNKPLYLMQSHCCECWDRFFDGGIILHLRLNN